MFPGDLLDFQALLHMRFHICGNLLYFSGSAPAVRHFISCLPQGFPVIHDQIDPYLRHTAVLFQPLHIVRTSRLKHISDCPCQFRQTVCRTKGRPPGKTGLPDTFLHLGTTGTQTDIIEEILRVSLDFHFRLRGDRQHISHVYAIIFPACCYTSAPFGYDK